MLLNRLGSAWTALQATLRERVRVLIVDDEEIVRQVLSDLTEICGYQAVAVEDAEKAIAELRSSEYDLLITDKNLPGSDGVDLIAQTRAEGMKIPAILVTAYPSVHTVSRALKVGAADYITKPFEDVAHVQRRLVSVVETHHAGKLLGRMVQDLQDVVESHSVDSDTVKRVGRELFAFKQRLGECPEVMVIEPEPRIAELSRLFLHNAGLKVVTETTGPGALAAVSEEGGPLSAYVSLDMPGVHDLVGALVETDPGLEVVVSGRRARLDEAVEAVTRGASDFVLGATEGLDVLSARVRRAAARSRRRRLYLHLVATLYQAARELGHEAADALKEIVPEANRTYLDRVLSAPDTLPTDDVSLEEVFGGEEDLDFEITVAPMDAAGESNLELRGAETPATLIERIHYGIDQVDPQRTTEVPLTAMLRVYATVGELIRFFHDPAHYEDLDALKRFLGDAETGALAAMARAYYEDIRDHLPRDVLRDLEVGDRFAHPGPAGFEK